MESKKSEIVYIPIEKLIIDERVADLLDSIDRKIFPRIYEPCLYNDPHVVGKMSITRHNKIYKGLLKGSDIPPIKVAKHGSRYMVIDGRHRISASIRAGIPTISAKILY